MTNNNQNPTEEVTIYERTYLLPVLGSPSYMALQENIKQRQALVKTGKRKTGGILGLFAKEEDLTIEEKFAQLEYLRKDYNGVIGSLQKHKNTYENFFIELTQELEQVVFKIGHQLLSDEIERQELIKISRSPDVIADLEHQKDDLINDLVILGKYTLLMLKKIERLRYGIKKLAEDQEFQEKCLQKMVDDLVERKRLYDYYKKRQQTKNAIKEFGKATGKFEVTLSPVLGEVDKLINEASDLDQGLQYTVNDIKNLVSEMTKLEGGGLISSDEEINKNILQFLVVGEEKRSRLPDAIEEAKELNLKTDDIPFDLEIEETLDGFQSNLVQQLKEWRLNFGYDPSPQILIPATPNINQNIVVKQAPSTPQNYQSDPSESPLISTNNPQNFTEILSGKGLFSKSVELEMIYIPGGTFMMGSNESDNEKPIHQVTVKPFYMGKYQVTQAQYQALMGKNPSHFSNAKKAPLSKGGWGDHPVECVSWHDAIAFCEKLSKETGKKYNLPSEAQWEYACRAILPSPSGRGAGGEGKYYFGDDESKLKEYAWYNENSGNQTHPVGQLKPNNFGLYDMHGNVCEWCLDDWHSNYSGAPNDGSAWSIEKDFQYAILRGGAWCLLYDYCRSAFRNLSFVGRDDLNNLIGFRFVGVVALRT